MGAFMLKAKIVAVSIGVLLAASSLAAQSPNVSSSLLAEDANNTDGGGYRPAATVQNASVGWAPFSRIAIGASFVTLGPGVQVTTNVNRHLNLRATGNAFYYSTNFTTSGFNANAKLNMVSAGVSADIYPFHSGFRVSPGLLAVNNNKVTGNSLVAAGTSFTLNGDTYYSANVNAATGATPLTANGLLGLNTTKPAFTVTGGWGNTIPRNGGHWSFPAEVGVALTGAPSVNATLTGWACADQAQTECTNVASTTDPNALQIQSDLAAQIAKWKHDLNPLETYPIVSFGVAYSFPVRGGGGAR
jgi:hypothetical protein